MNAMVGSSSNFYYDKIEFLILLVSNTLHTVKVLKAPQNVHLYEYYYSVY